MRAVWLSSTYYLDPAIEGLSGNAERLFTRALAYCGNAETSGYVTSSALKKLGILRPTRSVHELVAAGIWDECDGGGWVFRNWAAWQSNGDDLLKRQKADRERQARRRAKERKESRDMSRDVTPPEQSRGEKNGKTVGKSSQVSDARGCQTGPPVNAEAWKLIRAAVPTEHPQATKTALAIEAGTLLHAGTPAADVSAALELWLSKPNLGPRTLPSLVSEVIRTRDRPTTNGHAMSTSDLRFAQAQALKDHPGDDPLELM